METKETSTEFKGISAEIEFTNGKILKGILSEKIESLRETITILIESIHTLQRYPMNEICTIRLFDNQNGGLSCPSSPMEVTTITGQIHRIYPLEESKHPLGFWAFPIERTKAGYSKIFFTYSGVKSRCEIRPLGEIAKDQGILNEQQVEEVVAEQQSLRERKIGEIISYQTAIPRKTIDEILDKARKEGKHPRLRVGDILIESGLVTKEQIERALAEQEKGKKKKLGELLVEKGLISEEQLLKVLAYKFRIPIVDLDKEVVNPRALETVPVEIAQRFKIFPLLDDGAKLIIATAEPTDYSIYDYLRFYTNRKVEIVAATRRQIEEAIERNYPKASLFSDQALADLTILEEKEEVEEEEAVRISESDSQIVNLVNKILIDAYNKDASDIHLEPGVGENPFTIRYRIDGICRVVHHIPNNYKRAIISRLKIMAGLDISERRRPQSGKILLKYQNRKIEYRLEITPTVGGNEDAVLRILSSAKPLPLEKMGFAPEVLKKFQSLLKHPYGIILCVGPTGSGKTTTLHSALGYINTEDKKIWTAEDPVEIVQPGLRQVQVLHKIGLGFSEVLRSFLRADPDVIMIGEMRDFETAKTAIEASLTGHLVLSTLHTNSAIETIVRLIEIGIDPINFSNALLGILAQRLARRLCEKCKIPYHPAREEFERLVSLYNGHWYDQDSMPRYSQDLILWRKEGCNACAGTGYRGRIAIYELAIGTEKLKKAIKERASVDEMKEIALEDGMRTLLMDGIRKIFSGDTDLEQVLKVCITTTVSEYR